MLAEVHLVHIHLEDLLFREAVLELEGDHDLGDLARDLLIRSEKKPTRKLLRECRSTAIHSMCKDILYGAFEGADVVDAAVLKEAAVFDREDRLHHLRRNLAIGHHAPFGAAAALGESSDELRLELVACKRSPVLCRDGLHHAIAGHD